MKKSIIIIGYCMAVGFSTSLVAHLFVAISPEWLTGSIFMVAGALAFSIGVLMGNIEDDQNG